MLILKETNSSTRQVTDADVALLISKSPSKQSQLDPIPTWLLKKCATKLVPFLTVMMNESLQSGCVPASMKSAIVTPIIKKPNLDSTNLNNFRPVSNLSFISKLLEKVVSRQLVNYLDISRLLPKFQSAYRADHSTETALLRVHSDLVAASDAGKISLIALLDLSAAFDTVDHAILLERLSTEFGLHGVALSWIESYLTGRQQSVKCSGTVSAPMNVTCGIPQGSVLGPLLFILYTAGLHRVIQKHGLNGHFYADDTQVYSNCLPKDADALKDKMLLCLNEIRSWMDSNRLKLNPSKTEFMWCSTTHQRHLISNAPFDFGGVQIAPAKSVRLLGVTIDSELNMSTHISKTISSCFYQLRRMKSVRRSLPIDAAKTVINAFIISRVDYCNGIMAGITLKQVDRMQSILNSSARFLYGGTRRDHVTPLLRDKLHWLRYQQRVTYKLCLTVYKALNNRAPVYISELVLPLSSNASTRRLRSADTQCIRNPGARKKFGERGFSVAGPLAWNSLPANVRLAPCLSSFKNLLKTELFNRSY